MAYESSEMTLLTCRIVIREQSSGRPDTGLSGRIPDNAGHRTVRRPVSGIFSGTGHVRRPVSGHDLEAGHVRRPVSGRDVKTGQISMDRYRQITVKLAVICFKTAVND